MDYEKKYKKALERANELNYVSDKDSLQRKTVEHIFPELKESNDEGIRKSIIGFLIIISSLKDGKTVSNEDFDSKELLSLASWLENKDGRKPWNEEDEKMFNRCIKTMKGAYYLDGEALYWLENRFKSLSLQNTVTNEEFAQAKKDAYNDALNKIEYHSDEPTFDDGWSAAIDYIRKKSITPQITWEPSDEQMATFWDAICNLSQDGYKWINDMKSLYQDLKKLKK